MEKTYHSQSLFFVCTLENQIEMRYIKTNGENRRMGIPCRMQRKAKKKVGTV